MNRTSTMSNALRLGLVALAGTLMLGSAARAAELRPGSTSIPNLPAPRGQLHEITGRVVLGDCPATLIDTALQVREYWYVKNDRVLERPFGLQDNGFFNYDELVKGGKKFRQGRVLASGHVNEDGTFRLTWNEIASASRIPWVENVYQVGPRSLDPDDPFGFAKRTIYRMLEVEAAMVAGFLIGIEDPTPVVSFFGTETKKAVGTIEVDCFSIGG